MNPVSTTMHSSDSSGATSAKATAAGTGTAATQSASTDPFAALLLAMQAGLTGGAAPAPTQSNGVSGASGASGTIKTATKTSSNGTIQGGLSAAGQMTSRTTPRPKSSQGSRQQGVQGENWRDALSSNAKSVSDATQSLNLLKERAVSAQTFAKVLAPSLAGGQSAGIVKRDVSLTSRDGAGQAATALGKEDKAVPKQALLGTEALPSQSGSNSEGLGAAVMSKAHAFGDNQPGSHGGKTQGQHAILHSDGTTLNVAMDGTQGLLSMGAKGTVPTPANQAAAPSQSVTYGDLQSLFGVTAGAVGAAGNGQHSISVQVHPAGLGTIVVQVQQTPNGMTVGLLSNQMQVSQWLNQNAEALQSRLSQSGLPVGQIAVTFGDTSLQNQQQGSPDRRQRTQDITFRTPRIRSSEPTFESVQGAPGQARQLGWQGSVHGGWV